MMMKNSNFLAIQFVLIVVIASYILEKPNYKLNASESNMVYTQNKVDHFSVVVAQPGSKVFIMSPWPAVEYPTCCLRRDKRFNLPPSYIIRNDTLFLFACSSKSDYGGDSFFCSGIKDIVGMEKSLIHFYYLHTDTLNITLRYSELLGDFDTRNNFLKQINIQADSSRIDLKTAAFKDINLQLNRSHLKMETSFVKSIVRGNLGNYSGLYLVGHQELAIMKDFTSYSNK